jgi:hypothetical protein
MEEKAGQLKIVISGATSTILDPVNPSDGRNMSIG